ncbi:CbrC family protein, partial [Pseudomonas aeruginosa]
EALRQALGSQLPDFLTPRVAADIVTEVCERTPGYTSWQQERWLVCCEDACAFRGDAGREEIGQLGAEGLAQRFADFAWPAITW